MVSTIVDFSILIVLISCCRAAKEIFKLDTCVGVDLSEDMLRVAEHLEGNRKKKIDPKEVLID